MLGERAEAGLGHSPGTPERAYAILRSSSSTPGNRGNSNPSKRRSSKTYSPATPSAGWSCRRATVRRRCSPALLSTTASSAPLPACRSPHRLGSRPRSCTGRLRASSYGLQGCTRKSRRRFRWRRASVPSSAFPSARKRVSRRLQNWMADLIAPPTRNTKA